MKFRLVVLAIPRHAQLGRIDEARKIAQECIEHKGECAMTTEDWRKFWIAELKFKNDAPIGRLIEGLDKVGLVKHQGYPVFEVSLIAVAQKVVSHPCPPGYYRR